MNIWKLTEANDFEKVEKKRKILRWHDGPFRYKNDGLIPKGAAKHIQKKALELDEVKHIQENLMYTSPNKFFNTKDYIWYHTGKAGEAPDFLGFHPEEGVSIVEVKWLRGWEKSLPDQILRYVNTVKGNKSLPLKIWAISAQGLSESVKNSLLDLPEICRSNFGFHDVKIQLGQFFIGWDEQENFYVKLEWLKS